MIPARFDYELAESVDHAIELLGSGGDAKLLAGGWSYLKMTRRAQDWATVGVAAVQANGSARVALTNMDATPVRARGVEEALASGADPAAAAERAAEGTSPPSDHSASGEFRQHLARVLTKRALEEALGS